MRTGKTIVVLHLAGQYPLAGIAWQALHYTVALARMGHDVYYVDDTGAWPYDPRVKSVVKDCRYSVGFLQSVLEPFGLGERWAYFDVTHDRYYGISRERLSRLYREADLLLNVCGATRLREEHLSCPVRVYVETDPVYEQVKLARGNRGSRRALEAYTHHFTYGENMGSPDCPIPLKFFDWKTTRPPVMLDLWRTTIRGDADRFTTITTWRNAGKDIHFDGLDYYWSKHLNFLRFQDLPMLSPQRFEIALENVDAASKKKLERKGWLLADPAPISSSVQAYREYIYGSRGEFSVAKDLVVRTRSGWFSDRSVCYLAAGKPVITQETGFSKFLPTGRGLFGFETMEQIVSSVNEINGDYPAHCKAAREIAAECFDARKVLAKLLRDVGA